MIYVAVLACIVYTTILSIPYALDLYRKHKTSMSFKESLDLSGVPVVTFYIGDRKLNFMLDSGSNNNIIDTEYLDIPHRKLEGATGTLSGMDGIVREISFIEFDFYYKKHKFTDVFQVTDMSNAFKKIKDNYGITIHGIVGSNFFSKYQFILDFKDLIAYAKK